MKKLFAVLGLAILGVVAVNAQKLSIDKDVHDYGTIKQYSNGTCEFVITNEGNAPLIINKCQGSCGCTVPSCPTEPVAPGQTAKITVKYDTKRLGNIAKQVTIYSNDPDQPTKVIRIKGFIEGAQEGSTSPIKSGN